MTLKGSLNFVFKNKAKTIPFKWESDFGKHAETFVMKRFFIVFTLIIVTVISRAQSTGYSCKNGIVYYCNEKIEIADVSTFKVLKYGYAKDKNNVYYKGDVLKFVEPSTFKLKEKKEVNRKDTSDTDYYKVENEVFYKGKKVKGVFTIRDFKDLGDGYAIDSFYAYYNGVRIEGAHATGFKNLGKGYAKDSFHTYFNGKRTE